jgi:flagellar basal body-associated protein FliL
VSPEDEEAAKARRRRSIAIALGLVAFVTLIYVITMVRLGGNVGERPL